MGQTQTFFLFNTEYYGDSTWAPFLCHGYLKDYKHTMEELEDEEGLALQEVISVIFKRLHCFPVMVAPSTKSNRWIWAKLSPRSALCHKLHVLQIEVGGECRG